MSKAVLQRSWPDRTDNGATDALPVRNGQDDREAADRERHSLPQVDTEDERSLTPPFTTIQNPISKDKSTKHRFGLPAGFVSRLSLSGRTILYLDNVYRLPNGIEFIPQPPAGTLGVRNHQYALLTLTQYEKRLRGSVYIRTDGRIFDYAFDHNQTDRDLFDTGFTIHDLERTGRYAPAPQTGTTASRNRKKARKNRRTAQSKSRRGK